MADRKQTTSEPDARGMVEIVLTQERDGLVVGRKLKVRKDQIETPAIQTAIETLNQSMDYLMALPLAELRTGHCWGIVGKVEAAPETKPVELPDPSTPLPDDAREPLPGQPGWYPGIPAKPHQDIPARDSTTPAAV